MLFLGIAGLFLIPRGAADPDAAVLVRGQGRRHPVRVYLGSRTLPRFRYDQLMSFAWTFMFPVALINLFITGLLVALTSNNYGRDPLPDLRGDRCGLRHQPGAADAPDLERACR